jgi:hypothetical protein
MHQNIDIYDTDIPVKDIFHYNKKLCNENKQP